MQTALTPPTAITERSMPYNKAINEALHQAMELCPEVLVLGQLVDYSKSAIFGTTTGLVERFGSDRVQDFPVAESLMTSAAIGAAVAGMRPVLVHQRLDFMIYSLDAIVNWLALWRFKSNGHSSAPVTIRVVIGKGWGQGPQHSKSLHSWFAHLPGLKVALPATAFDAKGLLMESIFSEDPAIILEHRGLFSMTDKVPEFPYRVRFGQAIVRRPGDDLTLVAIGAMVPVALRVAETLATHGYSAEVIDLRTVSPLDKDTILTSVAKTKRLAVADPAWQSFSVASEVITLACENLGREMVANPVRICFPDSHTPMSMTLEELYYPSDSTILETLLPLFK